MAYTHEEVLELLGDEAQAVPGAIIVFRDKHIEVARLGVGGGFELTPEGAELLAGLTPVGVKPVKKGGKKVVALPDDPTVDDIDLN